MTLKMISFLKKIPIPICGLTLGLVSVGNLLYSLGFSEVGNFYDIIGSLLFVLVLLKVIFTMNHSLETLKDPIIGSVSPTFTMSLMVISAFLNRFFPNSLIVQGIWWLAVILHFALMIYFVYLHILPEKVHIGHVYPSWFITFVGLGVISVTSPSFNLSVGRAVIWFGLFSYFLLLPIILKRVFIFKKMKEPTLPLITIITAPGSLCLAGYLNTIGTTAPYFIIFLVILSQLIYLLALVMVVKLVKLPFYPSYAAFTFPLVISATAINLAQKSGVMSFVDLSVIVAIEVIVALAVTSYVFVRYVIFLVKNYLSLL